MSKPTPSEVRVLEQLCKGLTNNQIAEQLKIKECTVRHHLSHLSHHFKVSSRAQLVIRWNERPPPLRRTDRFSRPEVLTEKVRKAFEKSGMSKSQLADLLGWHRPDIDKLNRMLGYTPDCNSRDGRRGKPRQMMNYSLALAVCKALNASPFEMGI